VRKLLSAWLAEEEEIPAQEGLAAACWSSQPIHACRQRRLASVSRGS
jgi:hypothetical protein